MLTKEQKERFSRNGYTYPEEKEITIENDSEPHFITRFAVFTIIVIFCIRIIELIAEMGLFLAAIAFSSLILWAPFLIYVILIKGSD